MSDVATVPGNVIMFPGVGNFTQPFVGQLGEAFVQGDAVYQHPNNNKYYLCDSSSVLKASCAGFCTASGTPGQFCSILPSNMLQLSTTPSTIYFGVDLTIAKVFVISNNPGKIKDICSIGDGEFVTITGYAINSRVMAVIQVMTSRPYNEFITNPGDAIGLLGLTYP